jgi:PAS domain S-box-containing protein
MTEAYHSASRGVIMAEDQSPPPRDRLAQALRAERERAQVHLRLALKTGGVALWEQDPASRAFQADPRLLELYGVAPAANGEVPFEVWTARVHPEDVVRIAEALERLRTGSTREIHEEFRVVRPDGTLRFVSAAAAGLYGETGRLERIVGVNIDVTGREGLLRALRERVKELDLLHKVAQLQQRADLPDPELLRQVVRLMPEAWQHPECCEARIAHAGTEVSTPGWRDSPWKQSADFATSAGPGRIEVVYTQPRPGAAEGPFLAEERALLESLAEMLARHLELRRHQRDLEELVATRTAELRQLERLRDDLVHMVVHDMRTPLTVLMMRLEQLRSQVGPGPERLLDGAVRGAAAVSQMANALLDVSRLEEGKMPLERAPCDLSRLASEVRNALVPLDAGRAIVLHCPAPVTLACDGGLVRRVIENLVSNGVKHTPDGGVLRLSVEALPGRARIAVQDEGPGVPTEARQRIFEKFGTVAARRDDSYHSAGLGLAFCKLAVEAHGGAIGVDSVQPHGSLFWVELPA